MREYRKKLEEPKTLIEKSESWIRGLNQLVSATQIKPNELAEAVDIELVEDGKIKCPRQGQDYYGAQQGSRVRGVSPFYGSDGTIHLLMHSGTAVYKYVDSTTWSAVTGHTYTSGNMNTTMAADRLYMVNGVDALTYYDGTDITDFTGIGSANTPTATPTGGTGSYTYSYKITALTDVGESAPSTAGTATSDSAELDSDDYMSLSWSVTTSATGYNVYGRKAGQWFFMKYLEGNGSTSYVDKGQDTPNEAFIIRDGDGTAGPVGKYIEVYKDSLFIAGDPDNPSRLYYSGGGDQINNFTIGGGGGLIDISKNDGQSITGLKIFKDSILVFKSDSIYQFSFTSSGLPQVIQVTNSIGAIAPRSIVAVENDVFFLSRRGVFTIGNEAGFAFDVLRTNELSARVRPAVQAIDSAYTQNASAIYATTSDYNLYILSYTPAGSTTNSAAIVYDRERLAWYKWTNIKANCWTKYIDSTGTTHFLYGCDESGYVKEIFSGTDDFGSGINGYFYLKGEAFKTGIDHYKTLKDLDLVLRTPSGSISLSIVQDGVTTAVTAPIGTISPSINWGHYTFTDFTFADSQGSGVASADELLLRSLKNLNLRNGKTFQIRIDNDSSASFVLLDARMTAKPRSDRYRQSSDLITA